MVKRKNNPNKNASILVKFYPATDKEIFKLLKNLNLTGTRVSNLINRWTIDVPFWKEKFFTDKLLNSDLVERIHPSPTINNRKIENHPQEEEGFDEQ